jgi:hypothetical protein
MRLPEQEIIAGLQHPSLFVREYVAEYLADCNRTQADVTRLLIAAIEQFGWSEVLQFPHRVASFEVDESSLPWLFAQMERRDEGAPTENLRWHLAGMLAHAPIAIARPHLSDILAIEAMHRTRTNFQENRTNAELLELRNNLWDLSEDECWRRLEEHCHDVADVETFEDADIPLAAALIEQIARAEGRARDRALKELERADPFDDQENPWLPGLMINLAGRLRLEAAAPLIYRQFARDWDWYNEEIMQALKKIGGPAVTALVADNYVGSQEHVRIYSWGILEDVHHDRSVDDILRILPHENDEENRGQLGVALASHFDERGVEPALEIYREDPDDPERSTVIGRLYAHACLANLDRPEKEQWLEWLERDWESLKGTYSQLDGLAEALLRRERNDWSDEDWSDDDEFATAALGSLMTQHDEIESYRPMQPIVRETTRVGRNERCPCGSGKKYKNCCLRRDAD